MAPAAEHAEQAEASHPVEERLPPRLRNMRNGAVGTEVAAVRDPGVVMRKPGGMSLENGAVNGIGVGTRRNAMVVAQVTVGTSRPARNTRQPVR